MKPEDRKRLKQHIEMIVEHKEPTHSQTEHIYDGAYLDVEISTDVKNDNPDYYNHNKTSTDNNNKPSISDVSVTQDVSTDSENDQSIEI